MSHPKLAHGRMARNIGQKYVNVTSESYEYEEWMKAKWVKREGSWLGEDRWRETPVRGDHSGEQRGRGGRWGEQVRREGEC